MEAIGRRDTDHLLALADPHVEWYSFLAAGDGAYRGHDGVRQYIRDLTEVFDVGRPEVKQSLGAGDVVLLVGRIHYRGKGSGVESDVAAGWMMKFRHGKLICFRAFRNPERALATVGLRD